MSNALMAPRKNKRSEASRAIAQAIIDQYQPTNAEEMQDALKDIFGPMFEAMLQGEMDTHLGYEPNDHGSKNTDNRRNGYGHKSLKTTYGDVEINVPIVADDDKKKEILKFSVLAFEKLKYAKHLSAIDQIEAENFEVFKDIFTGLDEIEATLYYQIIKERIEVIKVFQSITDDNALEKVIQVHLFNHLWLLDPSWERVDNTQYMETTVLNALNIEYNSLTSEEKAGRLDIGYRQTAGKHIVIELKRADRIVSTSEMVKQVKKYYGALNDVLASTYQSNYAFEILFVLGRPIDNDNSIDNRELVSKMLKPMNARVVYYKELIENAYKSYNEYIMANKQSQPLIDIFSELERSMND